MQTLILKNKTFKNAVRYSAIQELFKHNMCGIYIYIDHCNMINVHKMVLGFFLWQILTSWKRYL